MLRKNESLVVNPNLPQLLTLAKAVIDTGVYKTSHRTHAPSEPHVREADSLVTNSGSLKDARNRIATPNFLANCKLPRAGRSRESSKPILLLTKVDILHTKMSKGSGKTATSSYSWAMRVQAADRDGMVIWCLLTDQAYLNLCDDLKVGVFFQLIDFTIIMRRAPIGDDHYYPFCYLSEAVVVNTRYQKRQKLVGNAANGCFPNIVHVNRIETSKWARRPLAQLDNGKNRPGAASSNM